MYKISIYSPGILLTLPHNRKTIRTPYEYEIDDKDYKKTISMIKTHGINNYNIEFEEGDVIFPDSTSRKKIHHPLSFSDNVTINMSLGGGEPGIKS